MIYLCGSAQAAEQWGRIEEVDTSSLNPDLRICSSLGRAQGCRPRPSDRIVLLHNADDAAHAAYRWLLHAQELGRDRRAQSLRQAP